MDILYIEGWIGQLGRGLFNNLLITLLSAVVPLCLGVLLTFLASKSRIMETIFSWLSLPTECACPILLMLVLHFSVISDVQRMLPFAFPVPAVVTAILAFTLCFSFYMPARFVRGDSFLKNVLVNGLGLISSMFKWSFCVSFIGISDLVSECRMMGNRMYDYRYYVIPFIVCIVIVIWLEVGKRLVKQFMK